MTEVGDTNHQPFSSLSVGLNTKLNTKSYKTILKEDQLNESDVIHGHKRVYNIRLLNNHFLEADLNIISSGGYWLKPLSNSQLEKSWSDEMLSAFMTLGESYPEISAEIYVVTRLKSYK